MRFTNDLDYDQEWNAFLALDYDLDGLISPTDLIRALKGQHDEQTIKDALYYRHHQRKPALTFLDFLTYVLDKNILLNNLDHMRDVFDFFDHDKRGIIEPCDLQAVLGSEKISESVWAEMLT